MKEVAVVFFLLFFYSCACNKKTGPEQRKIANGRIKGIGEQLTNCIDSTMIKKDANCIMSYEPVCGCDGKTYSNACIAENAGVKRFTKGECK